MLATCAKKIGVRDVAFFLCFVFAASSLLLDWSWQVLWQIVVAVTTCVLTDLVCYGLKKREWYFSETAAISGLIVAMVMARGAPWYTVVSASAMAMLSKHSIRVSNKHVFNPAAFGLVAAGLLFGVYYGWWSETSLWLVVIFGLLVVSLLNYWALVCSFLVTLTLVKAMWFLIVSLPLAAIFSDVLASTPLFFVFFMLTEPMTSPTVQREQLIFGIVVALGVFLFNLIPALITYTVLLALLIGNVVAAFFRWRNNRSYTAEQSPLTLVAQGLVFRVWRPE